MIILHGYSVYSVGFKVHHILPEHRKLTFFGFSEPVLYDDSFKFIRYLNGLLGKKIGGYSVNNIINFVSCNQKAEKNGKERYIAVLFEYTNGRNYIKRGILFISKPDKGIYIAGVWPYTYFKEIYTNPEKIKELPNLLISEPGNFKNLLIISK